MGVVWAGVLPLAAGLAATVALVRTQRLREMEPGWAIRQRLGLLLVATPIFTLLGVGLTSLPSLGQATKAAAASPDLLASKALLHLILYLAVPAVGLALVLGRRLPSVTRQVLIPGGRKATVTALKTCAALSAGLSGVVLLAWASTGGDGGLLAADGASLFFSRTTPVIALALSATAALTEELLFRGVVLDWLEQRTPVAVAVGVQALAFGLIHAGYGSIAHVIGAMAFGVLMGVLVRRHGLAPAIGAHLLVNLVILALWSGHRILFVPAGVVVVGLLVGSWWLESRERPTAAPAASG